jgi:hypothetical protein
MDTWGLIIIGVCAILYFITRKRSPGWAQFFLLGSGIGIGIVIGALWAYSIVDSILP